MYSSLALTAVPLVSPQNLRMFREIWIWCLGQGNSRQDAGRPGLKSVFFLGPSQLSAISSGCAGSRVSLDEHLQLAGEGCWLEHIIPGLSELSFSFGSVPWRRPLEVGSRSNVRRFFGKSLLGRGRMEYLADL